ncbi:Fic family protein [Fulvitalea axinellae]|uniref:Fic family protein n=1 Tax=Fulvitalea axinellae TaxID=1182444 RepID=UPI0030CA4A4E
MESNRFSREVRVFHGRTVPEKGKVVGYGALIDGLGLRVPMPGRLALVSERHRKYETGDWLVFSARYEPEDSLYRHLVFALKYEGINLLFFRKLFGAVGPDRIRDLVSEEPSGQYSRRIWFLYEWLTGDLLDLPDLGRGNTVFLVDGKLQYALGRGERSARHRIENNLPGTREFCPLVFRTPALEGFVSECLRDRQEDFLYSVHKDVLQRASAFLLLKDSKASFTIEGERPENNRAVRWGRAIGQAGGRALDIDELLRLQQLVIESSRFTKMGLRDIGGFVGEHDRDTGEPIPEHISASWKDVADLTEGILGAYRKLESSEMDPVLVASCVAFGFVFVHPFVDGNGRLHRYLIHHILARMGFARAGVVFPVSAAILDRIDEYRKALESFSHPLLDFVEWRSTEDHNVEVLNDTADYYRYYDATPQAEFLYRCVRDTVLEVVPREVRYLRCYDEMKAFLDREFEMPDKTVATLVRFLEQNGGRLSKRARTKEFSALDEGEVLAIERKFGEVFLE